jgi:pimeloyl-ACP methyl ester carboxylesterase
MRGFGLSDAPANVNAYAIDALAADVLALLDDAGVERGVVIGHDWGADIAWKTACVTSRPRRPYVPAAW